MYERGDIRGTRARWLWLWLAAAACALIALAGPAAALTPNTDGTPDQTFGVGGLASVDLGGSDYAQSIARQADGKIVAAGWTDARGSQDFGLARLTPNGNPDPSFGVGGEVVTALDSTRPDWALAVAIQPDGKIVAAGGAPAPDGFDHEIALVRYESDGSLDPSFGIGGIVRTGPAAGAGLSFDVTAMTLQPDGKILISGTAFLGATRLAVARYNGDGSLDASFGAGGFSFGAPGVFNTARSMALQPDGKIVTAGFGGADFAVTRLNGNGSPDTSFGAGGTAIAEFGSDPSGAYAVVVQPDGRIVAAGQRVMPDATQPNYDWALVRYTPAGLLDPTFGSGGKVILNRERLEYATAVGLQPDGRILVAGSGGRFGFSIARLKSDGSIDPTFAASGVNSDLRLLAAAANLVVQPDGKVVVAGMTFPGIDFGVARLRNGEGDPGRADQVTLEFVGDLGAPVVRWGDKAGGDTVAITRIDGALEAITANGHFGDPVATISAELRSRHVARLMAGSLTATRGTARIQFRDAISPFATAADGSVTSQPIRATYTDGVNVVFGRVTVQFLDS